MRLFQADLTAAVSNVADRVRHMEMRRSSATSAHRIEMMHRDPYLVLADLLKALFETPAELRAMIMAHCPMSVSRELPGEIASIAVLADEVTSLFRRRGGLDSGFATELRSRFPLERERLDFVFARLHQPAERHVT